MKYNVGIIGFGFVGRAVHHGFAQTANFYIYDVDERVSENTFEEVVSLSDFIFVCVPTPTDIETGKQDTSIIESVFEKAKSLHIEHEPIFIIKSTLIPGTTASLREKYPELRIIFNPEFLTERTYKLDFINASRIILGGNEIDCILVKSLYQERFPEGSVPIHIVDETTAEAVKELTNSFLAAKVSLCNEIYDICKGLGISYDQTMGLILADGRIGRSHTVVPGHDGDRGFGGKCFPKDLVATKTLAKEKGVKTPILDAAWEKNLEVRRNKDWLKIKGAMS